MYSAVRTHDYDYPESEMDDRESLYFDTISLADSEAAAAAAAHRKSLSQSRNTIYHSAVDLIGDETPSKRSSLRLPNANRAQTNGNNNYNSWHAYNNHNNNNNYRHSSALEHYNGVPMTARGAAGSGGPGTDATDAAIAAQMFALHNGRPALGAGNAGPAGVGAYPRSHRPQYMQNDEVSRQLLQSTTTTNSTTPSTTSATTLTNKNKKMPITYSEWKFRTHRRFQDGVRSVDFVLVYSGDDHKLENARKRETFEANLIREGLHLERDESQKIHFIKLHAPLDVLCRYAEILKIKLPMKKIPGQDSIRDEYFSFKDTISGLCARIFRFIQLDPEKFPRRPYRLHCEFSRNYQHLFPLDQEDFFDAGVRNSIINFILERQNFIEGEETPDNLGIEKLLDDGVYSSAYTLHEDQKRELLLSEWARLKNWKNLQPLDNIKEYFGPKVALYFAWLGFYTSMLVPVSIFGVLCFIYGFLTWNTDPISHKICNDNQTTLMCPQCDRSCDYWQLQDTCKSSKMNYLIDNNVTVVFAFAMALWAVLYLELWKRYSAGLVHRWGLTGFSHDVEHPRMQYLAKIRNSKKLKKKPQLSNNYPLDPDVPFWSIKFLPSLTSYAIMILFICCSVIAIGSLIVYRMAQRASHSILGNEDSMTYKIMVLPMTAGIIDLIVISVLDYAYAYLAVYLTNLEYCRTQTEYDESLTIKNYTFQFVNYYSSLFYIAFLKGKFVGYPAKYNRVFGFRQEECNPGGCLMELCMQLVIIMVGKQAVNAIVEMLIPYLLRTFKKYTNRKRETKEKLVPCNQWTEDYHLAPWTKDTMFYEYLEMVLQFGFVTLFGLAFPLAPLLALINNMIEVRLDALKMLQLFRRPVAQRARNIGVWYGIMVVVTKIAVVSSAMIIAFSTNLIPKFVYRTATKDDSLEGYLNFTLAYFNTDDFQIQPLLSHSDRYSNVSICRYTEFRNPPWDDHKYKRPMIYWKILTARLAFIVIFQNIISMLQTVIAWAIPDVSGKLLKRIKRENFLLREHIIDYEKKTAAEKAIAQRALDEQQTGEYQLTQANDQMTSDDFELRKGNDNDAQAQDAQQTSPV